MIPVPQATPDVELFPPNSPPAIEAAFIGWPGDDDVADVGSDDNDGVTFIKITLARGGTPDEVPAVGEGKGARLLARLSGFPFWCIPPKGMQCFVAFPAGFETTPGIGVIIALPGANPFVQFSKTRAKLDVGENQDLVLKARSISLSTYENDFIAVGPDTGIVMQSKDGHQVVMQDGKIVLAVVDGDLDTKTSIALEGDCANIVQKDSSGQIANIEVQGGEVTINGKSFHANTMGGNLGPLAMPATGIQFGPGIGMPSSTWSVSP